MSLEATNLCYSIKNGNARLDIIRGIFISVAPGDMCALMGASGAGKSTLLDLLADRKLTGFWSGNILFEKKQRTKWFNRQSTYVLQDDIHIPTMSVEECLLFSASLKLPEGTPTSEIKTRVNELLHLLSLNEIRKSRVGSTLKRGISGGQLKRLSIGVEIVAKPKLIFLDEPTSGLDSALAMEVAVAIQRLSSMNHTCIATMHQPSTAIFRLFNKVALIAEGKLAYFGPSESIVPYFCSSQFGFQVDKRNNPAEFILDICSGGLISTSFGGPITAFQLENMYAKSSIFTAVKDIIETQEIDEYVKTDEVFERLHATSKLTAFRKLTMRNWIQTMRDTDDLIALFGKSVIVGILIGTVFYNQANVHPPFFVDGIPVAAVTNVSSLLFFGTIDALFSNMGAIPNLLMKNTIYRRELASNTYATSPYWLSQIVTPIPVLFVNYVTFTFIFYFLCGFPTSLEYFVYFLLILFLCNLSTYYYAMFLAAFTRNQELSFLLFPLTVLVLSTFSGYAVTVNSVPAFWAWVPWIDFARWSFEGLMTNQWGKYSDDPSGNVLEIYDFQSFNRNWSYLILLFTISILWVLIYYSLWPERKSLVKTNDYVDIGTMDRTTNSLDLESHLENDFEEKLLSATPSYSTDESNYLNSQYADYLSNNKSILSFHNICFSMTKKSDKSAMTILHNINGYVEKGECCALMGSSGAGKSTLLDVIVGRKNYGVIEGDVFYNSCPRDSTFFSSTAYVMQDDLHFGDLSVNDCLYFAAEFRLPESMSKQEKMRRITFISEILSLTNVINTVVGTKDRRGISGGQMKRLSIGVEIISLPSVVFLDEPTTGLDSVLALEVISTVRKLADFNRIIISTIHQPSEKIMKMFDKILLLSCGKLVYFGPTSSVIHYFTSSLYQFPISDDENPYDFMISICSGNGKSGSGFTITTEELVDLYNHSEHYLVLKSVLDGIFGQNQSTVGHLDIRRLSTLAAEMKQLRSMLFQTKTLTIRILTRYKRDTRIIVSGFFRSIFVGLFYGTIYFNLKGGESSSVYINRLSVLFFSILNNVATHQHIIPEQIDQRIMFYHERSSGLYGALPYWISTWLVHSVLIILNAFVYSVVVYFLSGLNSAPHAFITFLVCMILSSFIGFFVAQFVSSICPTTQAAVSLFPVVLFISVAFAGYIVYLPLFPMWLSWGPYISFIRFSFQALVLNEFHGNHKLPNAPAYLNLLGFNGLEVSECLLILVVFITFYGLAQYIVLKFIKHEEK
eukprot:gene12788-17145_t